jgi:creatinine amidohydrolase/Fe(II)-dependent formamide hydrolase-like protein
VIPDARQVLHPAAPDEHDRVLLEVVTDTGDVGVDCVRMDVLRDAVGDPVLEGGQRRDPTVPRVNNGISGDARRSSAELGKELFDLRVEYAVRQIRRELGKN